MGQSCCGTAGAARPVISCNRRTFIAGGISAGVLLSWPALAVAGGFGNPAGSRYALWLERQITGERVAAPFTLDGRSVYMPGYAQICGLLRDVHVSVAQGDVQISLRTIEALWSVQQYLLRAGVREPIIVHSGYRTPQTNAMTEGAARQSYHMYGMAVDFHIPGVNVSYLADICEALPISGGVGYYADGWVHLDSGPKRTWSG